MNNFFATIGNLLMLLYAIASFVFAIYLTVDIFKSKECKNRIKTKQLVKSMETSSFTPLTKTVNKIPVSYEHKSSDIPLTKLEISEFYHINNHNMIMTIKSFA